MLSAVVTKEAGQPSLPETGSFHDLGPASLRMCCCGSEEERKVTDNEKIAGVKVSRRFILLPSTTFLPIRYHIRKMLSTYSR